MYYLWNMMYETEIIAGVFYSFCIASKTFWVNFRLRPERLGVTISSCASNEVLFRFGVRFPLRDGVVVVEDMSFISSFKWPATGNPVTIGKGGGGSGSGGSANGGY